MYPLSIPSPFLEGGTTLCTTLCEVVIRLLQEIGCELAQPSNAACLETMGVDGEEVTA